MAEVTHNCPREGESVTLCCGRSPFELAAFDRLTLDASLVTCKTGDVRGIRDDAQKGDDRG